jgi:hypothetical protein
MCPACIASTAAIVAGAKQLRNGHLPMNHPPIVSQQDWEAAREKLLLKEKAAMRSHDALAAERLRYDGARASGDLGGLASGLPSDPAVQVVELARQLRRRELA